MMRRPLVGTFGLLSLVFAAAACTAAPADAPSDDPESDEAAVVAARQQCSPAAYNQAFAHYKAAVDHAKARARGEVCGDGTMLSEIASDLGKAVSTCGQFESIVATSKWAQPVRDALKGNLALPTLTGKLKAKDLSGLKEALPGSTVFGPAPGVFGNMSKITFAADGKATVSRLHVSDEGEARWSDTPATWSLKAANVIAITSDGATTELTITAEPGTVEYRLRPKSGDEDFWSMPSECEA